MTTSYVVSKPQMCHSTNAQVSLDNVRDGPQPSQFRTCRREVSLHIKHPRRACDTHEGMQIGFGMGLLRSLSPKTLLGQISSRCQRMRTMEPIRCTAGILVMIVVHGAWRRGLPALLHSPWLILLMNKDSQELSSQRYLCCPVIISGNESEPSLGHIRIESKSNLED